MGNTSADPPSCAIRRAAKGELQIVREANFVAFVSPVESVAQAAADKAKSELTSANKRVEEELAKSRSEATVRMADTERRAQIMIEEAKATTPTPHSVGNSYQSAGTTKVELF